MMTKIRKIDYSTEKFNTLILFMSTNALSRLICHKYTKFIYIKINFCLNYYIFILDIIYG